MKNYNRTIFASTVPNFIKTGVNIIRISGKQAFLASSALGYKKKITPRYLDYVKLTNPNSGEIIDYAMIVHFTGPHSFTGDDTVELHVHGSAAIIADIFSVLSKIEGFFMAEAGEFTHRAFLNGKIDLTQAEGIIDLINAETKLQQAQALNQLQGSLRNLYTNWRTSLIEISAQIEALIDFPEEDIPEYLTLNIDKSISKIRKEFSDHINDNNVGENLTSGVKVVIAGTTNAGKSTLYNYFIQKDEAIISNIAGTTRDSISCKIVFKEIPINIIDTAGFRNTSDIIEQKGIEKAKNHINDANIIIVLIDSLSSKTDANLLLNYMNEIKADKIFFLTRCDLIENQDKLQSLQKDYEQQTSQTVGTIHFNEEVCVSDPVIIDHLYQISKKHIATTELPTITKSRHREKMTKALSSLDSCDIANKPLETNAEDLRLTIKYIGDITGYIDNEEILDSLFKQFCIGK